MIKIKLRRFLLILVLFLFPLIVRGQVIPRDTWPESWFHDPKTASELGITKFHQSPMLDEAVRTGKLPPVEERLPKDPIVVEPIEGIGEYGGKAVFFGQGGWGEGETVNPPGQLLIMDPEVKEVHANLAKGWEFKDGGKTLILHLREGMKWSDGYPYTADDLMFYYKQLLTNKEWNPVIGREWKLGGKVMTFEKIDDYTIAFHTETPDPYFLNLLAERHSIEWISPPAHYLKKFHPDFVPREELMKEVKKQGFQEWTTYLNYMSNITNPKSACPSMRPFILVKQTPTILIAERNPYYPKIDPAGNQLPYIDRIEIHYVQNTEMMTAKAATGQAAFAGQYTRIQDIPLFKFHEKKGNYRTLIWRRIHGNDCIIQFNFNCLEDKELRKIFWDVRFRKALSLAIDREEINQILYYGRAVPRQTTVLPTSKFYEEEFAKAYAEYDPKKASELLDEMGMVDVDGDGMRERPSGKPLNITLEWALVQTSKDLIMELVVDQWKKVGINIALKEINSSLQGVRAPASLMDMTLWEADRSTDILFPPEPYWYVPMHLGWEISMWNEWTRWFLTDGEKGEEPPPVIKELYNWWIEMSTTLDEQKRIELGKKILRSQAENLWTIGTVGVAPHPLVVSNKLHNVPKTGYWGWDCRWSLPYCPETWYLKQ